MLERAEKPTETLATQARHLPTNACSAGVRHHQAAMNGRTSVRLKVYMYIKSLKNAFDQEEKKTGQTLLNLARAKFYF